MTTIERKEKFMEAYRRYEEEADEAKFSAMAAKRDNRKSDYDFWMVIYENARERMNHFYLEYLNA